MSDPQHARQPDPLSRCHQRLRGLAAASLLAGCGLALGAAPQPPLFDVHLHYTGVDAAALPPEEIIGILDDSGVTRVVVSGMPTSAVERLHAAAPARIIPFLSVYNAPGAKRDWMHDEDLPARVAELLDAAGGIYPEWRAFFTEQADRVLVGVDTFWTRRWKRFDQVSAEIRGWLAQLPHEVADQLAYGNAERLFGNVIAGWKAGGPSAGRCRASVALRVVEPGTQAGEGRLGSYWMSDSK